MACNHKKLPAPPYMCVKTTVLIKGKTTSTTGCQCHRETIAL